MANRLNAGEKIHLALLLCQKRRRQGEAQTRKNDDW